jgi:zinc D-Ala-D-Ala carboxypeptidase
MNLSPHFTLEEMVKSQTALRLGLDNNPGPEELEAMVDLCEYALEPIRKYWNRPVIVSSAFRAPEVNKAIGSKNTSQHTKGQAADIEIPGIDNLDLYHWIGQSVEFDQLILEFYSGEPASGWVHVSYVSRETNRRERLRIDKSGIHREQ